MEYGRPRGRNRRGANNYQPSYQNIPQLAADKGHSILDSLYSLLILASLITVVYILLEYHCNTCNSAKHNIYSITKNLELITNDLVVMKNNYAELETRISEVSRELPKIEGQFVVLEALANAMEYSRLPLESRMAVYQPNVHTVLASTELNTTVKRRQPRLSRF